MRLLKLIIVLLIVFLPVAYVFYTKATKPLTVEILRVEMKDLILSVSAPGEIRAEKEAELKFSSTGTIIYLPYKVGDEVEKGEHLASIDGTQTLKNLENARLDKKKAVDFADEIRETYEGNLDEGPGLYKLKQAEKAVEQAENQIRNYENALYNLSLYAPFSGTILEVNKKVGETAETINLEPIIKLTDMATLYFEASIDEEDIGKVISEQKAEIKLDAYPETTLAGEVYWIDETASQDEGGNKIYKTEIKINQPDKVVLRLGLSGDVEIVQQEKKQTLVMPLEAVFKEQEETYVYTIVGGFAKKQKVILGLENDDFVEILEGLSEGDIVAVSDLDKITEGQSVLVKYR